MGLPALNEAFPARLAQTSDEDEQTGHQMLANDTCVVERPRSGSLKTVLLVDDRDDCRFTTKWFLGNFGYAVDSVRSAEQALALFDSKVHDIVVTDNSMPGMSGEEMAHIVKMRSPATPILMYSGNPPNDKSCLDLFIQRPAHLLELKQGLERLLGPNVSA